MNTRKFPARDAAPEVPSARAGRLAVWILLALGLLLMLVSTSKAEQVTRVNRVNGTLSAGKTLQVENVSGDLLASPGREFSAVVTFTASAPTKSKAEELLAGTSVRQSHDEDGWSLETRVPGMRNGGDRHRGASCRDCKVVARYEIVVPPGVNLSLQTVNGDVRVRDCDGELQLETVNGSIDARGVRGTLQAQTVNGKIEAAASALPSDGNIDLQTVNGGITLTLPKDAKLDFSGETMNGTIASTFPFRPPAPEPAERPSAKTKERKHKIVVQDQEGDESVVDVEELEAEIAESMKDVETEMRAAEKSLRENERELRRIRVPDPRREYSGSIGKGGAAVHVQTLNGTVLLLAAGTSEADAKPLVSERRSFVVTVPEIRVRVAPPAIPAYPPKAPHPPVPPVPAVADEEGDIVRGDISGDFLSTSTDSSYRIGKVSGKVRILTHSGEIRVRGIGAGGDLKTFGGDILVGPVSGDLKANTMAGDIRAESVSGSALADTAGGDVRIQRVGGNLEAKTSGGDIIVPAVGGSVRATTAGGDVRIGVLSRDIKGGITIHNSGGDVSLSLPADCKAEVELVVTGPDDDTAIRSEFPDLSISKRSGSQRATATLNGGGEKIVVRTTSGTIRLKKNAP
ncbi:MAG: DUF4097 family beta strand repeat-containing protein [Thermoanaerobaculia bacterium]